MSAPGPRSPHQLRAVAAVGVGSLVVAAGCGSHSHANGTIEIGKSVSKQSLFKSVAGVDQGSSTADLRSAFGPPVRKVAVRQDMCSVYWVYHAHKLGSVIDEIDFCLGSDQRVKQIVIAGHDANQS
jgi:hypothetical protein